MSKLTEALAFAGNTLFLSVIALAVFAGLCWLLGLIDP